MPGRTIRRTSALAVAISAAAVGLVMIVVAFLVGSCDAFGGRCPAPRPPLHEDDTFGTAAAGAALALGLPVALLVRPLRRTLVGLGAAALAAVLVGLVARAGAG
jgi:hypothetical protein